MFKSKYFYSLIIAVLISFSGYAQSMAWYVCVGSYGTEENASILKAVVVENKLPARIYKTENDSRTVYRVLVNNPCYFLEDAHELRDKIVQLPFVDKLGITGIWVCKAPYEEIDYGDYVETLDLPEAKIVPVPTVPNTEKSILSEVLSETEVALDTNKTELPVSEETPFSVLVRSYKEEQTANYNKDRLVEQDIDAYVLKKFDEDDYFSFDLHAGAFEDPEQAEILQEKLEDLGIYDTQIAEFSEYEESLEDYNRIVAVAPVVYDNAAVTDEDVREVFSPEVLRCIRQFPITENFELQQIHIFDYDNIEKLGDDTGVPSDKIEKFFVDADSVHAATLSFYKDGLFGNEVTIYVETANPGELDVNLENLVDSTEVSKLKLKVADGILDCIMINDNDEYLICGINTDKSMLAFVDGKNFTAEQFEVFLKNMYNDSSLLIYPQVRKNLMVMPARNILVPRNFLYFSLEKVDDEYAAQRNYSNWSVPIVGHWNAEALFAQGESIVNVAFFDMDYDYNAKRVHRMFMEYRKNSPVTAGNYSPDFKYSTAWYSNNMFSESNELSFATKSYIIAIDSWGPKLSLSDLTNIGYDLKIWKLLPEK